MKSATSNKIVILRTCDFINLSCEILDLKQNRHPEQSALTDLSRDRTPGGAESKDLGGAYLTHAARSFSTTEARKQDLLRYALDGHGNSFSWTVIIFHPPGLCKAGPSKMRASS
jgi:hypothetical protein